MMTVSSNNRIRIIERVDRQPCYSVGFIIVKIQKNATSLRILNEVVSFLFFDRLVNFNICNFASVKLRVKFGYAA